MHCGEYCHKRLLCLGTPQTLKASDECLPTSSLEGTGRCVASSRTLGLDTVSTGSDSDLVSDQYARFVVILTRIVDQVAIAPCTDCVQE